MSLCSDCMTCPLCHCDIKAAMAAALFLPKNGGTPFCYALCATCSSRVQRATDEERLSLLALIEAALEGGAHA